MVYKPEELAEEALRYLKDIFKGEEELPEGGDDEVALQGGHGGGRDHLGVTPLARQPSRSDHGYVMDLDPVLEAGGKDKTPGMDPRGYLDKDFTAQEVAEMITSLGGGKASGWDEIPNEALKNAPKPLLDLLVRLYNNVKESGTVPAPWRKGRLVLVHKKGSRSDVYNYRPLTVLNSVCGLYTKLLNARLTKVVETHRLLGEVQNGFRRGRSGTDCGFILNTVLWKCSARRRKPHLAFLDIQKAYDSVDRFLLLLLAMVLPLLLLLVLLLLMVHIHNASCFLLYRIYHLLLDLLSLLIPLVLLPLVHIPTPAPS